MTRGNRNVATIDPLSPTSINLAKCLRQLECFRRASRGDPFHHQMASRWQNSEGNASGLWGQWDEFCRWICLELLEVKIQCMLLPGLKLLSRMCWTHSACETWTKSAGIATKPVATPCRQDICHVYLWIWYDIYIYIICVIYCYIIDVPVYTNFKNNCICSPLPGRWTTCDVIPLVSMCIFMTQLRRENHHHYQLSLWSLSLLSSSSSS